MRKTATELVKRMGHSKLAEINGREEKLFHIGDAKRARKDKSISKRQHARRARNVKITHNINSEALTEFEEFYGNKF